MLPSLQILAFRNSPFFLLNFYGHCPDDERKGLPFPPVPFLLNPPVRRRPWPRLPVSFFSYFVVISFLSCTQRIGRRCGLLGNDLKRDNCCMGMPARLLTCTGDRNNTAAYFLLPSAGRPKESLRNCRRESSRSRNSSSAIELRIESFMQKFDIAFASTGDR